MRTAIYARVSTSHHNQNPEIQINEMRRFCESRSWEIAFELVDHGYSGSTDNRPALKRLNQLIDERQIEIVIVVKLDRLFRSLKHLVTSLENFEKRGVKFVALRDNVDYSTPSGRLFVQIMGSLGEFERSLLRERTMIGLEHARASGKKFGRPRKHDQEEIIRRYLAGQTYRQISNVMGAPIGTIARALKSARKTQTIDATNSRTDHARNTTVYGADQSTEHPEKESDDTDTMTEAEDSSR